MTKVQQVTTEADANDLGRALVEANSKYYRWYILPSLSMSTWGTYLTDALVGRGAPLPQFGRLQLGDLNMVLFMLGWFVLFTTWAIYRIVPILRAEQGWCTCTLFDQMYERYSGLQQLPDQF
jgi:hypothetical protein